jgi:hypothetical protein
MVCLLDIEFLNESKRAIMKVASTTLTTLAIAIAVAVGGAAQECSDYISGDINSNNEASPFADVIYMINMFNGGLGPVDTCECMDPAFPCPQCQVDFDLFCSVDALDLWRLLGYWTGRDDFLNYCPNCPPPQADPSAPIWGPDPGTPDTIILGNLDFSPMITFPGDVLEIPVWVKNDELVSGLNISVSADTSYLVQWLDGILWTPMEDWGPLTGFYVSGLDSLWPSYTSQSLLGWSWLNGQAFNSGDSYIRIASFKMELNSDTSLFSDTTRIIPSMHWRCGAPAFCDTMGLQEWSPVILGGLISLSAHPTEIDFSPEAFAETLVVDSSIMRQFVVSNLGSFELHYSLDAYDIPWFWFDHWGGNVNPGESDTVEITFDASSLNPGNYITQFTVLSNDLDEDPAYVGVSLKVWEYACAYVPGDITGSGGVNGLDVTYGVYYLKGGTPPSIDCGSPSGPCPQESPFYAAGDVNGNCSFNGPDITFFVSYLKGNQSALLYCPSCPPGGGF